VNRELVQELGKRCPDQRIATLDQDAAIIESRKREALWTYEGERTKGAVNLHLLLDHQSLLPSFALVTEGRVHESRVARSLRFDPGTTSSASEGRSYIAIQESGIKS
jgi:hypothetical protein